MMSDNRITYNARIGDVMIKPPDTRRKLEKDRFSTVTYGANSDGAIVGQPCHDKYVPAKMLSDSRSILKDRYSRHLRSFKKFWRFMRFLAPPVSPSSAGAAPNLPAAPPGWGTDSALPSSRSSANKFPKGGGWIAP